MTQIDKKIDEKVDLNEVLKKTHFFDTKVS
jgi:hypothetical protein